MLNGEGIKLVSGTDIGRLTFTDSVFGAAIFGGFNVESDFVLSVIPDLPSVSRDASDVWDRCEYAKLSVLGLYLLPPDTCIVIVVGVSLGLGLTDLLLFWQIQQEPICVDSVV